MSDRVDTYGGSLVVDSNTFMGAERVAPDDLTEHEANVGVLGFPYDGGSVLRGGQNMGPNAIRTATDQFLFYHYDYDLDLSDQYTFADCGDVPVVPGDNATTLERGRDLHGAVLDAGAIPVLLGGDHLVSVSGFESLADRADDPGIVMLDSHFDTAEDVAGVRYNHCTSIARAVDEAGVDPERIALVGMNGMLNARDEVEWVRDRGVNVYPLDEVVERGAAAVAEDVATVVNDGTDAVYLSVDQDALDSSQSVGTTAPTPCGMTARELLTLVAGVASRGIDAVDVVETSPSYDPGRQSAAMAVRVVLEALAANATGEANVPGSGNRAARTGYRG
jgi:agmatinase